MSKEKRKNMVILKNLPSNILEEAIVILKPNVDARSFEEINNKNDNIYKDYIINEAKMIISNYISTIEMNKDEEKTKKFKVKFKLFKGISFILGLLLILSFLIK